VAYSVTDGGDDVVRLADCSLEYMDHYNETSKEPRNHGISASYSDSSNHKILFIHVHHIVSCVSCIITSSKSRGSQVEGRERYSRGNFVCSCMLQSRHIVGIIWAPRNSCHRSDVNHGTRYTSVPTRGYERFHTGTETHVSREQTIEYRGRDPTQ
jgi:hypothetical protein